MTNNRRTDTTRWPLVATTLSLSVLAALAGCAGAPERAETAAAPMLVAPTAAEAKANAAEALAKGDKDLALRAYVQAAEQDPTDAAVFYAIGALYADRGDNRLAARAYTRVVQIDPQHTGALEHLGLIYFADRQFEQARPLLTRAAGSDVALWRSHNALGLIADALGEHADAAIHFAAALTANPGSAAVLNNRGYSRYLAGSYDAAERDFRAALAAEPGYDKAWQNLGLIYARRGDYGTAVKTLERVVSPFVAANDVGYIAMVSGDYQVADQMFAEAIRLSPRYYQTANENLAELRRRRSDAAVAAQYRAP
jgi:Flp pilus assembly protein TadD